jgi:hypothetical protein
MLRYSYKVLLEETEARRLGFLLDLKRAKTEEAKYSAQMKMDTADKEIKWISERIESGNDPGCITL